MNRRSWSSSTSSSRWVPACRAAPPHASPPRALPAVFKRPGRPPNDIGHSFLKQNVLPHVQVTECEGQLDSLPETEEDITDVVDDLTAPDNEQVWS